MFRRAFLRTLSAVSTLPLIPDRLLLEQRPPVLSEDSLMFWFHFYGTVQRDRPMSTERARKKTVEELDLQNLNDDEVVQLLKLANEGVYDTDDMPEWWQSVFGKMGENHHP